VIRYNRWKLMAGDTIHRWEMMAGDTI